MNNMISSPFIIEKNLSINNSMKISLTSGQEIFDNLSPIILKVFLNLSYHFESFEFNLQASTRKNEETNNIEFNMGDILEAIFSKLGKNFTQDYFLSYYMDNFEESNTEKNKIKTYIYFGEINLDNIKQNKNLFFKIPRDNILYLKLWQKLRKELLLDPSFFEKQEEDYSNNLLKDFHLDEEEDEKKNEKSGRIKEKTIGYAIIKVAKWEKIREKSNDFTLDEAAKSIGMAKKTLDDYKNQIKKGKEKNFNFNKYYKCKMNVLKNFNNNKIKLE